ncbi:MAG: secretin N-terminal domain-containing protein [Candidatus Omnitrophota bacterium]
MNKKAGGIFIVLALLFLTGLSFAQDDKPLSETPESPAKEAPAEAPPAPVETKPAGTAAVTPPEPAPARPDEAVAVTPPAEAAKPIEPAVSSPSAEEAPAEEKKEDLSASPVEPGNVTVNFKGADIKTVLAYISEVSGVDIVPAPDVKGVVDLKLTNKPWKVALDIILRNYGFAYEREGDIIRVVTVSQLKQEELASQAYNLNYSKCKDVVDSIKNIVSEKGKVTYDERTNTVIVTDIPTNLYKISQIISRLDKKTQQVLIEARVIETVLDDSEKLGIDWNVKVSASGAKRPITFPFEQFKAGFGKDQEGLNYFPQVLTSSPQSAIGGSGVATTTLAAEFPSTASGTFAFPYATTDDFKFGTLDFSEFTAVLEMLKSRSNTDTVSNPRIATLNNHEALINVGQTLNLPKYERNSSTGKMEITGYDPKDLGIILKVTPHINDVNEIVVDLEPQISSLLRYDTLDAASGVVAPVFSSRTAKTQVMIKDNQTIFIGGLIQESDVDTKKKLPIIGDVLGDVPYLGMLVSKKETIKQKTELIFFITVNMMLGDQEVKGTPKSENIYNPAFTLMKTAGKIPKKKEKKR